MTQKLLPKIAAKSPAAVEVEKGKTYFWCSCGLSQKQPFCDGRHKSCQDEDGKTMKSVPFKAQESKTVYFCNCKHSKKGALCDGSHAKL